MYKTKKNASFLVTVIILCAFLILNVIYVGIAVLAKNNASIITKDLEPSAISQSEHLLVNDIQSSPIESMDSKGIVLIAQAQLNVTGGIVISSFFIYFIIATNVQDYNLFPSQAKLNQTTRQKIYELISQNEGIHLREICRTLDKKMGVIQYHIYVLENANLISSMKDGRYKRFFVNHQGSPEERLIISILQRETTGKILSLIFETNENGISHSTLAKELNSSSQAVMWHVNKLTEAGIITARKSGCQKIYQITPEFLPILDTLL